jgi:hypothetical protein
MAVMCLPFRWNAWVLCLQVLTTAGVSACRDPRILPLMLKPFDVSAGCVGRQGSHQALP